MGKLGRRMGGAIGMGVTWAAAWGVAGMVPRWLFGFNTDVPFPLVFGVLGFLAGVTFSALLALFEGRRWLGQMTHWRFAGWGALSGLLLSALFTRIASLGAADVLLVAPAFVVAGAVCASGSLALAKRAETRELRESGRRSIRGELNDDAKRKLSSGGG
jgi:hypothetical protein